MDTIVNLFFLSLIGSVIALLGGVVFLYNRKLARVLQKHSISFAAGILITVSLLVLLPEALDQIGENALIVVLFAFFGAYLFEHFFVFIHHHEDRQHTHRRVDLESSVPLVIVGDTIHNFIDGVAIAASFFVSPGLGLITALSTFLHEIPHEIGDFGILLKAGWKKSKILWVNILSASATVVGAFLTFFFAESSAFIGFMLAVSSGIFLYLGTIDFLPHISDGYSSKARSLVPLAIGIGIMLATVLFIPHAH